MNATQNFSNILLSINRKAFGQYHYYVAYVAKDDGRDGDGYYCKTMEEAIETKARMESVFGADGWDVVIREVNHRG